MPTKPVSHHSGTVYAYNDIVLTTINARYIHASIGLRYLYANLKDLKQRAVIQEYDTIWKVQDIAERILSVRPAIVGVGVYIWNVTEVVRLLSILKQISPETKLILGGPEVSYHPFRADYDRADYIVQGEGEKSFYTLCRSILDGKTQDHRLIEATCPDLKEISLPYRLYSDDDIRNRVIYVEASRGCPFSCEFCLSSIDKTVRIFDIDVLLDELDALWKRGARRIKFVDRTFNLHVETAGRILDFFLNREPPFLVHFEMIPDRFPGRIKEKIKRFPPASLQFEIGIQTLNPEVAKRINRPLNAEKISENLRFLETETDAHLHVDLIIGLPGESLESFGNNLKILTSLTTAEIQLGILKKLSGTSISRHDEKYGVFYSNDPPYDILQNNLIPFPMMQKLKRFARFWDLIYNSGNFTLTIPLLWKDRDVFTSFFSLSEWIYGKTKSTWHISLNRLTGLLFEYLTVEYELEKTFLADTLARDLLKVSGRKLPMVIRTNVSDLPELPAKELGTISRRQQKHL